MTLRNLVISSAALGLLTAPSVAFAGTRSSEAVVTFSNGHDASGKSSDRFAAWSEGQDHREDRGNHYGIGNGRGHEEHGRGHGYGHEDGHSNGRGHYEYKSDGT